MEVPRNHRLIYVSSPDRGLDILLPMWPRIKEKFPDATLECYYGFNLFEAGYRDNAERMGWMRKMLDLCKQPGVQYLGRVSKIELKKAEEKAGILAYPCYFPEISCISVLECQSVGCVPVTMDSFALKETVGSGIKVEGDIFDKATQERFLVELLKLMGDQKQWEKQSGQAHLFAKGFSWDTLSNKWLEVFNS